MSIFDHPDTVSAASSWRCPGCRTLQAQTTRCWRCSKAAYSCDSCHRYRPSVAAGIGYCANDPTREPLRADETRSCWEGTATPAPGPGLFDAPEATPEPRLVFRPAIATAASLRPVPGQTDPAPAARPRRKAKPPLEEPGRAGWVESEPDKLVDAPVVEPGGGRDHERRGHRRRRWFG